MPPMPSRQRLISQNPVPRRTAFTLIEVLVVVAIIALLVAILIPSLARAREQARRAICASRLHNIGLANQLYSQTNRNKLIQCMTVGNPDETNPAVSTFPNYTQVCIEPRLKVPGTPLTPGTEYLSYQYMDWWKIGKKYLIDHELWECPNRPGMFGLEGNPDPVIQGYTTADLKNQKYNVNTSVSYQQWTLGFQYFAGMSVWDMQWLLGGYSTSNVSIFVNPPSPKDYNRAKPQWMLASDSNIKGASGWGVETGTERPSLIRYTPPHPDGDGGPAGGNVLFCDGSVAWIPRPKWVPWSYWHDAVNGRRVYGYQSELGDYGTALVKNNISRGMPK